MQLQPIKQTRKDKTWINALAKTAPLHLIEDFLNDTMQLVCISVANGPYYLIRNGEKTMGYTEYANIAFAWLYNGSLFTQKELTAIAKTGWSNEN